jgi:predicted nucleic acid-binding protein
MALVIDASIALCWALTDEDHRVAELALIRIRTDDAYVPRLWWFEVRNALLVNERRRRISERDVELFLHDLEAIRIVADTAPNETDVFSLARRHRLTFYDAAYLELARRRDVPLATLDGQLADAAKAEKVSLLAQ